MVLYETLTQECAALILGYSHFLPPGEMSLLRLYSTQRTKTSSRGPRLSTPRTKTCSRGPRLWAILASPSGRNVADCLSWSLFLTDGRARGGSRRNGRTGYNGMVSRSEEHTSELQSL